MSRTTKIEKQEDKGADIQETQRGTVCGTYVLGDKMRYSSRGKMRCGAGIGNCETV